eukprot:Rhum_TRINITY_DN15549_c0_g1::Rhum_TRINITY_DN15549_c0_g1_i1::g.161183::m.161183
MPAVGLPPLSVHLRRVILALPRRDRLQQVQRVLGRRALRRPQRDVRHLRRRQRQRLARQAEARHPSHGADRETHRLSVADHLVADQLAPCAIQALLVQHVAESRLGGTVALRHAPAAVQQRAVQASIVAVAAAAAPAVGAVVLPQRVENAAGCTLLPPLLVQQRLHRPVQPLHVESVADEADAVAAVDGRVGRRSSRLIRRVLRGRLGRHTLRQRRKHSLARLLPRRRRGCVREKRPENAPQHPCCDPLSPQRRARPPHTHVVQRADARRIRCGKPAARKQHLRHRVGGGCSRVAAATAAAVGAARAQAPEGRRRGLRRAGCKVAVGDPLDDRGDDSVGGGRGGVDGHRVVVGGGALLRGGVELQALRQQVNDVGAALAQRRVRGPCGDALPAQRGRAAEVDEDDAAEELRNKDARARCEVAAVEHDDCGVLRTLQHVLLDDAPHLLVHLTRHVRLVVPHAQRLRHVVPRKVQHVAAPRHQLPRHALERRRLAAPRQTHRHDQRVPRRRHRRPQPVQVRAHRRRACFEPVEHLGQLRALEQHGGLVPPVAVAVLLCGRLRHLLLRLAVDPREDVCHDQAVVRRQPRPQLHDLRYSARAEAASRIACVDAGSRHLLQHAACEPLDLVAQRLHLHPEVHERRRAAQRRRGTGAGAVEDAGHDRRRHGEGRHEALRRAAHGDGGVAVDVAAVVEIATRRLGPRRGGGSVVAVAAPLRAGVERRPEALPAQRVRGDDGQLRRRRRLTHQVRQRPLAHGCGVDDHQERQPLQRRGLAHRVPRVVCGVHALAHDCGAVLAEERRQPRLTRRRVVAPGSRQHAAGQVDVAPCQRVLRRDDETVAIGRRADDNDEAGHLALDEHRAHRTLHGCVPQQPAHVLHLWELVQPAQSHAAVASHEERAGAAGQRGAAAGVRVGLLVEADAAEPVGLRGHAAAAVLVHKRVARRPDAAASSDGPFLLVAHRSDELIHL